ncbi:MAG: hypothetical protein WCJ42_05650 [Actinomycetes bacterium]
MNRSRTTSALVLCLPLALLLSACGHSNTSGQPSPLHLRQAAKGFAATADMAVLSGGYTLSGTLPTSPSSAPVFSWTAASTVSDTTVSALAKAFGVTGTPVRHAYGWVASDATGEIRVRDGAGAQWSFTTPDVTASCMGPIVDVDNATNNGTVSSCGVVGVAMGATAPSATAAPAPPTTPVPGPTQIPVDPPIVPADIAHAIVDPTIRALGILGAETVTPGMGSASVTLDPTVNGLPTQGISTYFQVDRTQVQYAGGWLTLPVAADTYPLVTADQAFKDLANRPQPMMGILCPQTLDATSNPCPTPPPIVITGAELGLELNFDATNAPILIPSWFFKTADAGYPITSIAIDPAYLAPATPSPVGTDIIPPSSGTGGGTNSSGGSGGGPVPTMVPPAAPPVATTPVG